MAKTAERGVVSNHIHTYYAYPTPYGPVTIGVTNGAVTRLVLGDVSLEGARKPSAASNKAATELQEYLAGKRREFSVAAAPAGSDFQRAVWRAAQNIPYGEARTNNEVAEILGKPGAFRAVGAAVRQNPTPLLVPAHRIVGANGRASGNDEHARLRDALLRMEREFLQSR